MCQLGLAIYTNQQMFTFMYPSKKQLFLASSSQARQRLLQEAAIPFQVIFHQAIEQFDSNNDLVTILLQVAREKMASINQLPNGIQEAYLLTADTMGRSKQGNIYAKPNNYQEAVSYIRCLRGLGYCGTAFCLEKRQYSNGSWLIKEQIEKVVIAEYEFDIPDTLIDLYLEQVPYQDLSGGISIEGFGAQFLKYIHGSYTTILGLPMFELRHALTDIGFFD